MHIRYSEFDSDEAMRRLSKKELMKLWNHLLLQASGDVDQALEWLKFIWMQHNLPGGEEGYDAFVEQLKRDRLIAEEPGSDGDAPTHTLTSRGERTIRQDSLEQIFGSLRSVGAGDHATPREGTGGDNLSETRPFQPGDLSIDVDYNRSITNALKRTGIDDFDLHESDLEVYEKEHHAACATVLMIDVSHSMILYGEDRITPAKRVAIALAELITTKYPKDSLDILTFGNDAEVISLADLPYLNVGPYHTNTKAGLRLAQRLLSKKRQTNKQIFMITDGKPSVIYDQDGQIYRNSFGLDPLIVNATLEEAAFLRRKRIHLSTFMIARDPILVEFVDKLTRLAKGSAYYSALDKLGSYVFVDYLRNRRRTLR